MSGVIPMVSASPPPFEEEGGDDWDADFGNFMGAEQSQHSESENWSAFPDSVSITEEKTVSPSHLSQEKENLNENVPPTATELKLNINGSNLISGSDSGLDLDSSNVTDSVSHDRQGLELNIDSGLCSTEVSPCDPASVMSDERDPQSLSTLTICDFSEQSSQSSIDSNQKSKDNSTAELHFNKSENVGISISSNDLDHCSKSFEKDAQRDPVKMDDSDDSEFSVRDVSTNEECKDSVVVDSSSIDLKSNSSSGAIHIDDDDDWGDFGKDNENINSSTSEILGIDQVNEKSKSSPTKSTEEVFSENHKDPPSKLESEINFHELSECTEVKSEGKENLEEEMESVKDKFDVKTDVSENSFEYLDKDADDEDTEDDFGETNFTAADADWMPAQREDLKALEAEEEEEATPNDFSNPCQLDSSEKNVINEEMENTDDQKVSEDICTQSEKNAAPGHEDDDEYEDFADFGSAPADDLEFKKEELNIHDGQENDDADDFDDFSDFDSAPPDDLKFKKEELNIHGGQENDDFDDFADFDSAPSKNVEVQENDKPSDQFAAFPTESTAGGDGNWASFQETSDNAEAQDVDWTASKDEWSNNDSRSRDQRNVGGDDEWQEGGGDDFGDFEDFDDEPTRPIQKEKVDELSDRTVSSCFHGDINDVDAGDDITSLDNYVQDKELASSPEKSSKVWGSLTKQATEAPLKWSQSRSNKQLFSSLKIDTRNILIGHKKPSVPIYASNLTLLEPTKGPAQPTKPEPTLVDTNKEEPQKQDIPPVQFDWSTSGLVNPLQGDKSKSLDLDFLVVQETETGGRSGVFDSELMHGQKPNLQPLENILANLKVSTVKKNRQTDKLGVEATKIIKTLPDLSFMQAKVLMFPIRHQAE